jgi:replicative DNA helicase
VRSIEQLVLPFIDRVTALAEGGNAVPGLASGYLDLDRMTTGLQPGELIVLAGRPSMGKTALALNIAEHAALRADVAVMVFSMEMAGEQLMPRLIGSLGRIDQQHLRTGQLSDDEWGRMSEAVHRYGRARLYIDDAPGLTPSEVRARARRQARLCGGLGLIVVDYLQLMSGTAGGSEENRATELGEISRALKGLARELNCPVLALSQLNRGVEQRNDKRPVMSDLRESGAIEQDADTIMFVYRDDYYYKDSKEPGIAELILAKQRNGPTGTVKLAFLKPYTRFENLAYGAI